jgi:IS30 family transposase
VSFSGGVERLVRLVDAGVPVSVAAGEVGLSRGTAYRHLRAAGRGGQPKTRIDDGLRRQVIAEFGPAGSVSKAARSAGLSHNAARRILVAAGLVPAQPDRGRTREASAEARSRFLALVEDGWSSARASREVGVHPRTGRDWHRGVRKSSNTRTYPDGTVVDSNTGTRYVTSMTRAAGVDNAVISDRYLSLDDRLVIADGLIVKQTLTQIAARIGKHVCTVSREVRRHSVEGVYLPHQAHQAAAAARGRPKQAKLVTDPRLRAEVELGLERRLSPRNRSRTGSYWTIPTTRACG